MSRWGRVRGGKKQLDFSLYGLWVEAVEEPPGIPDVWHEVKTSTKTTPQKVLSSVVAF